MSLWSISIRGSGISLSPPPHREWRLTEFPSIVDTDIEHAFA
jgi:hypothetical protein